MRKVSFFFDGRIIEQEIPENFGFFSILGLCEGIIGELLEYPIEVNKPDTLDHDG